MELATGLVQQAVEADPEGDNIKAQLSFVAYALATAASPEQQLGALKHADHLVSNARCRCNPFTSFCIHARNFLTHW